MKSRSMNSWLRFAAIFAIVFAAFAAMAATLPAAGESDSSNSSDQLFFEEFALEPGGRLTVDVDDMDIRLETNTGGISSVEIIVSGRNRDKGRDWFEKSHFEARLDGDNLVVENRDPRSNKFGFGNWYSNFSIRAVINIPRETDLDIDTEDGDVWIADVKGDARVYTEDGDLEFSDIRGTSIEINSEDGDIKADVLGADDIEIHTADGDLDIDTIDGKRVHVSSSDGDILMSQINGNEAIVETDDGDVSISRFDGDSMTVKAEDGDIELAASGRRLGVRCADGDLDITLLNVMEVDIKTNDGDIQLVIPKGADADIDLRGEHLSVRDIAIKGRVTDDTIEGSINNGGPMIRIRANDGSVRIREN